MARGRRTAAVGRKNPAAAPPQSKEAQLGVPLASAVCQWGRPIDLLSPTAAAGFQPSSPSPTDTGRLRLPVPHYGMPLHLQFTADTRLPIDFAGIGPEQLRRQSLAEIERQKIFCGNRQLPLAELFAVSGNPADGQIHLSGDLSNVHGIGARMVEGSIRIDGNAGGHLGAEMRGGRIEVFGNAGDWLGAEMHGGQIHVHGNAADNAAAAFPGSLRGMTGGELFIDGDAGSNLGTAMRRGMVAVGGSAGDCAGSRMIAGTIIIGGRCGRHAGAGMRRGTIVLMGGTGKRSLPVPAGELRQNRTAECGIESQMATPTGRLRLPVTYRPDSDDDSTAPLLPTFARGNRWNPQFMRLLAVHLARSGFAAAANWIDTDFACYHGDPLATGKGEILIRTT